VRNPVWSPLCFPFTLFSTWLLISFPVCSKLVPSTHPLGHFTDNFTLFTQFWQLCRPQFAGIPSSFSHPAFGHKPWHGTPKPLLTLVMRIFHRQGLYRPGFLRIFFITLDFRTPITKNIPKGPSYLIPGHVNILITRVKRAWGVWEYSIPRVMADDLGFLHSM